MSSFRKPVTIKRYATGATVNGRWVEDAAPSSFQISASVQPARSRDVSLLVELLPEGRKISETFRLYTSIHLNTLQSGQNPDRAVLDGHDYEVIMEATWQNNVINHYLYFVMRIL